MSEKIRRFGENRYHKLETKAHLTPELEGAIESLSRSNSLEHYNVSKNFEYHENVDDDINDTREFFGDWGDEER